MLLPMLGEKPLIDQREPAPPYFLTGKDMFVRTGGREIFVKKIASAASDMPRRGPVVMAPGLATNANIYRVPDSNGFLALDHNRSFANLLASEGFTVYLYHPGYCERVYNRYVAHHCTGSLYYQRRYKAPVGLDFLAMAEKEVPAVLKFVRNDYGSQDVSWVGYSMGGMIMYAYLSANDDPHVRNVVTVGSPITLNQIFVRLLPYTNVAAKTLGFEEYAFLGSVSKNFVPLTRLIRSLPTSVFRYNPLLLFLWNPFYLTGRTTRTLLGKVIEPIPRGLEGSITSMITEGVDNPSYSPEVLRGLPEERRRRVNFLFFYGQYDVIATPDTVLLAREIMSPGQTKNVVGVANAGHVDLLIGKRSLEKVWKPATSWLKAMTASQGAASPFSSYLFDSLL